MQPGSQDRLIRREKPVEHQSLDLLAVETNPELLPPHTLLGTIPMPHAGKQEQGRACHDPLESRDASLKHSLTGGDVDDLVLGKAAALLPTEVVEFRMAGGRVGTTGGNDGVAGSADMQPPLDVSGPHGQVPKIGCGWRLSHATVPTVDPSTATRLHGTSSRHDSIDQAVRLAREQYAALGVDVDAAVAAGANLATKGERTGAHFPPGVLTGVTKDSPTYREELFGPVAQVYKVHSEDEAIELANDIPFGLGSYLFTTDPEQADRVAERIEAGMVFVNVVEADGVELPFGGVKRSGFGRELGRFGIDEFVNKKLIRKG